MSIPKEPRQLMINVMYLVLTALLALNVSAEIFNAFSMVDKGLTSANSTLDASNSAMPGKISEAAKKQKDLAQYADRLPAISEIGKEGSSFIDDIVTKLKDGGGNKNGVVDDGDFIDKKGVKELVGKKNYDVTTRLMVTDGMGTQLKDKMLDIKSRLMALVDEEDKASVSLPIDIDDESWRKGTKGSWSNFTFGHMPVGATLPIFSKFKNDIKASEAAIYNYLSGKVGVGGADIVLDKYRVVSAPKKSYIIKGEPYEADIFLSAAAGANSKTGISISVNGSRVATDKDGVAKYKANPSSTGPKTYKAAISVKNPVTGEVDTYNETFSYEVGERSVAISPTKMNVFYIGVDNPIEVSAAGVNSNKINVSMGGGGGGSVTKNSDGTYNVRVTSVTPKGTFAKVNVTADGMNASKNFRVKRIPDPRPRLGNLSTGKVGDGSFKAFEKIVPRLEGFDFEAKCNITEFLMIRSPRRADPMFSLNKGGKYNQKSANLAKMATGGDQYIFQGIKCKCPGDKASRPIGDLVYTIK